MNHVAGIIGGAGFLVGYFLAISFILMALEKKKALFYLVPVLYCLLFEAAGSALQGRSYNTIFAVGFAVSVMVLGWLTVRFKIWMPWGR